MNSGLFEHYIENEHFYMKYAKGEPAVKDEEFHDYHEFIFYLRGNAYFLSKDIQQKLPLGCIVAIPKEHFHQFVVSEPDEYVRCIVGFWETDETKALISSVMTEVKIYAEPDERMTYLFERITEIAQSDLSESEKTLFIEAALHQLLVFLKQNARGAITKNVTVSEIVRAAIDFIDKNFEKDLSVPMIASRLFVSESTLSHKFSREMNLSIYQYILKKRLISAKMRIEKGESPSSAALNSGFSDYSSFYRAYKKSYK